MTIESETFWNVEIKCLECGVQVVTSLSDAFTEHGRPASPFCCHTCGHRMTWEMIDGVATLVSAIRRVK